MERKQAVERVASEVSQLENVWLDAGLQIFNHAHKFSDMLERSLRLGFIFNFGEVVDFHFSRAHVSPSVMLVYV